MKKALSIELPESFNKIMVFGLPGSGKSTFATKLAQYLNLPIFHLDKHFYVENWVERNYQEFLDIQQSFVKQPKWVIDGNALSESRCRHLLSLHGVCLPLANSKTCVSKELAYPRFSGRVYKERPFQAH